MSYKYTITDEDTLRQVAARVYGDKKLWVRIWNANKATLQYDPNFLAPGEVLTIPGEILIIPEREPVKNLSGKERGELSIVVGGRELTVLSARILRTMDTGTDAWSCQVPWSPGIDKKFDEVTKPYSYAKASVYIGGDLIINGRLYTVSPEMTDNGLIKTLTGYSFTADAVDSTINSVYERDNATLEQIAAEIIEPIGIKVVVGTDTGGPIDEATAKEQDTIFSHLSRLATQRGLLIGSTVQGDLLIHKANVDQKPVGTIEENKPLAVGWKATYDGRKRFNTYTSISQDWGASLDWFKPAESKNATAKDDAVPISRMLSFMANDTTSGNVLTAAEWKRSKQIVEALTLPFPVTSWYAPNGTVWKENTRVTVISPTLGLSKGFTFLIRAVEFTLDSGGQVATLSLVPPQAYSGEPLGDIWD